MSPLSTTMNPGVRKILRGGLIAAGSLAVLVGLALGAIWLFRTVIFGDVADRYETFRVTSPDRALDAVVYTTAVTATSPSGYDLHIVPAGRQPTDDETPVARLHGALRAGETEYGTEGLHLHWPDDVSLLVEYLEADSVPIEPTEPVVVDGRSVSVVLVDGVTDPVPPTPTAGR